MEKTLIPVSKPFLPPKKELFDILNGVYDRNWLTNHGPLVKEFEQLLSDYIKHPSLKYVANGTIALQVALQAIFKRGEVITTPFSYIATTSSIIWEGCIPKFVDIDEKSLNIDPKKIEASITDNTIAILATHIYGNPCNIELISDISEKHNLPVIYDAAHCFGTKYKRKSIFHFGDISTVSFHATKLFHTVEGGAIFSNRPQYHRPIEGLMNFGHTDTNSFDMAGINGRNSEFHAAMGVCNFKYLDSILESRRIQWTNYNNLLQNLKKVRTIEINEQCDYNYAYYPLICSTKELSDSIEKSLNKHNIQPRRYFSPSLNTIELIPKEKFDTCPISESVSERVLCLPMYYSLLEKDQSRICSIISQVVLD
ncbi:MAG: DegT/DnrJ/EryC1/StrS family aminotransferase [Flavobacteriales bacterium]|nr:DegT/DnrJ/EryC1/StrS family aminotransferase [Flavobacteriales bacterium]